MPLSPPSNPIKDLVPVLIGLTFALALYTISRSTLPHVGDNIHSLPHGGCYRDGTKTVVYNKPNKGGSSHSFAGKKPIYALVSIIILSAFIYGSEKFGNNNGHGASCSCNNQRT
uniref:Movement protein TGB2 n=1 Tax=Saffron betaflexivirus 1 TaxID=3119434 RepID=A0AAU6MVM3_9VIRU